MRKTYTSEFKAKVVLEILREEKTLAQIASETGVHINQLRQWKEATLESLPKIFDRKNREQDEEKKVAERKEEEYLKQIGKLTTHVEWLKKKSGLNPPF